MLWDADFLKESTLAKYLELAPHFDPFVLRPLMLLEAKPKRNEEEEIFLSLIKPSEQDMGKIVKALIVLAEEDYDEEQQSRFLNEKKNYGELEHRKKLIQKRRDTFGQNQHSHS